MTATIATQGLTARVQFTAPFDLDSYATFLRCKGLPEHELTYDWETDAYTLTTPARFAPMLGRADLAPAEAAPLPLPSHLFDYQAAIIARALAARRYAVWADTGLGKTAMFLEWARQVSASGGLTGGRVLILSPLQVIEQTRAEWTRWYPDAAPIARLDNREELAAWCLAGAGLAICNYEKLTAGVLPELRHLAGLVADESSMLKARGGVVKWNLIKSAKGIEYKLSCTATPAPNDPMEYASQARFLEKMRTEGEVLWTFFSRDKRGEWKVKPHAEAAFYRFMASWSIYLRDPARYGWTDILSTLPPPVYHEERLPLTDEQRTAMHTLQVQAGTGFFGHERMGVKQRAKFAQLARGFLYENGVARRVAAFKPARVAELAWHEVVLGQSTIIWTVFDEEAAIIAEHLTGLPAVRFVALDGQMSDTARAAAIAGFKDGTFNVLLTKPQLAGYGLNFQHCRAMVFSGLDDSFERMYQAVRRAYRFGQTEAVQVYVPYVPELEGMIFENVQAKEARFLTDVAAMEQHYIDAVKENHHAVA